MDWSDHITADPGVLMGKPVIKETRISAEFVIDLLAGGWTTEYILREYDRLTLEDIHACLACAGELAREEKAYPLPI